MQIDVLHRHESEMPFNCKTSKFYAVHIIFVISGIMDAEVRDIVKLSGQVKYISSYGGAIKWQAGLICVFCDPNSNEWKCEIRCNASRQPQIVRVSTVWPVQGASQQNAIWIKQLVSRCFWMPIRVLAMIWKLKNS